MAKKQATKRKAKTPYNYSGQTMMTKGMMKVRKMVKTGKAC